MLGRRQNRPEKYNAVRTNSSILGVTIPILFGQQRLAARLLDYNDFTVNKAKQQGGKGLGKGGTQYVYTASIIALLAQGPINALLNLWDSTGRFVLLSSSETFTVPGGGGNFTPSNASIFGTDQGVFVATPYTIGPFTDFGSPGSVTLAGTQNVPMTPVASSPGTGQYSVDPATGIYSFSANDVGKVVTVNYSFYRYQIITRETTVVPFTGPFTITVDNSANFKIDQGVVYFPSGTAFTKVGSSPSVGQYSQSGAVYTFNSADSGQGIVINYIYNDPNTNTNAPTTLNLTLVSGLLGQLPLSYMTGKHPSKALGYSQLAYIFSSGLFLGFSPTLPNYSYEVAGNFQVGGGIIDANPADCIFALLTDTGFGAGFPTSFIQPSLTQIQTRDVILASDLFNRANENPLASPPWTTASTNPPLQLVSNTAVPSPTGASNIFSASRYDGSTSWPNDQYSEAAITSGIAFSGNLAVTVRTDGVGNGYIGWVDFTNGASSHVGPGSSCEIVLTTMNNGLWGGGNPSPLFSRILLGMSPVLAGDVLRIQAVGNRISLLYNGLEILFAIDNSYTSGKPGLAIFRSNAFNAPDIAWDNWHAGVPGSIPSGSARNCWTANSFFISPIIDNQSPCAHIIGPWLEAGMVGAFFSEAQLKFVPYGDTTAVGNGIVYSPSTAPIVNITDDNYIITKSDDPIKVTRSPWQDAYNRTQVAYQARVNDYNPELIYEQDEASIGRFGLRIEDPQQYDFITTLTAAQYAASMRVQRTSYIRNQYIFNSPDTFSYLEPMDVISINDLLLGFSAAPVRIVKIEDDPKTGLTITAEDFIWGTAQPAYNPKSINSPYLLELGQQDPGSVTTPMIFESSHRINQGLGYQIWIGAAGLNPNWGGCHVWMSRNNIDFKQVADIDGSDAIASPARMGTATTAFAYHADPEGVPTVAPPTVAANVAAGGSTAWSNPNNSLIEDGIFADSVINTTGQSDLLEGTVFGFAIPTTETILGIQVDVKCFKTKTGLISLQPTDCQVQLMKSGTLVGSAISGNGGSSLAFSTFGGPTSLWGTTWTPTEINTQLGTAFRGFGLVGKNYHWFVDYVKVTIYLTGGTVTVALSQATQTLGSGTDADADNLVTLCLIDNELFSYTTATLVGSGQYTLGGRIRRGVLGTPIADHSIGAPFLRIDDSIFKISLDPQFVAQALYFKFTSFNLLGNQEQSLQNVTSYTYTPPGLHVPVTGTAPANVLSYQTKTNASGNALISFTWSAFNITRSDGSLVSVGASSSLPVLSAPSLSSVAGGALGSRTYFVRRAMVRYGMICAISAEASIAVPANQLLVVGSQLASPGYDGWIALVGTTTNSEFASPTLIPFGTTTYTEPSTGFVLSGNKYSDDPNGQFAVRAWNLAASTTYYLYPDVNLATILSILVEFAGGANGTINTAAAVSQNMQGNIAMSGGPLAGGITTPAVAGTGSGTSGGGAGGGAGGTGGRFLN